MSDKRSKALVATVVGIVILFVIVLMLIKSSENSCQLMDTKPSDEKNPANITSTERKSLLKLAAFMTYLKDNKITGYLPVTIVSSSYHSKENNRSLVLQSNCATITLAINKTSDELNVTRMTVELVTDSGSFKVCQVYAPQIQSPAGKHYDCNKKKTYDCVVEKDSNGKKEFQIIMKLVVDRFEFEVDLDQAKAKAGNFSTPAEICT